MTNIFKTLVISTLPFGLAFSAAAMAAPDNPLRDNHPRKCKAGHEQTCDKNSSTLKSLVGDTADSPWGNSDKPWGDHPERKCRPEREICYSD